MPDKPYEKFTLPRLNVVLQKIIEVSKMDDPATTKEAAALKLEIMNLTGPGIEEKRAKLQPRVVKFVGSHWDDAWAKLNF